MTCRVLCVASRGPTAVLMAAVVAAAVSTAHATARSWAINGSGNAAVATNWSPIGTPTAADDLTFNRTVNITVTFDNNVSSVNSHTYRGTHQVTLNITSPHNASSFFDIGTVSGDDAVCVMNTGELSCGGNITIGEVSGATGHFTIGGSSTLVRTTGTTDDIIVGGAGAGFLTLTGAAEARSTDDVIIGSSSTGNGTASVSGGSGSFPNASVSTLKTIGSNGASHIIVGNTGTGVLNLSNGGLADSINDVQLAPFSGASGTVTIGGAYDIFAARLHAAGNIDIARNNVVTNAGTGLATVNSGGILDADAILRIGDVNGGSGTLHIAGGAVFCGSLECDQTGHATLDFDDGTLTIVGGTMTPPTAALTLDGGVAGDNPTLRLNSGATYTPTGQLRVGNSRTASLEVNSGSLLDLTATATAPLIGANAGSDGSMTVSGTNSRVNAAGRSLNVGLSGAGALTVQSSGQVVTSDCIIASQVGSSGTATITGASSLLNVTSTLRVGISGNGTLNVQSGGQVDSNAAQVASVAGSTGTAVVTGAGSQWQTGSLFVGGSNAASGGNGNVNISTLGNVTVTGTCKVWPLGQISVDGTGRLDVPSGSIDLQGTVMLTNGGVVNGNVDVNNGTLRGAGTVNGEVFAGSSVSDIIVDGVMNLGLNTSLDGFQNLGTLTVNAAGDVTLRDANTALTGDVVMNGGTLTSTHGLSPGNGDVISGFGTINGDVIMTPTGSMSPGSGANALTIGGTLRNTTNNINGVKLNFGPGAAYIGSGQCIADITGDPTSHLDLTGTLTIGRSTTAGFSYLGTVNVGGNIMTVLDSNGAVFGGQTNLNSGRIECTNGMGNQTGGNIRGDGLFVGSITNSGVLDPHTNSQAGGLFTVQGNLVLNPTSVVDMEIGGPPASGNNDRINVSGTATFGGTIRVTLKNGYVPRVGEQFIAINATAGRTGTFATIIAPSGQNAPCNNVTFVMVYSSTAAIVLIRPPLGCTALGDLNSDGSCNGPDIPLFIAPLFNGIYNACSDMNGDCRNDADDIQIFVNCLF